MEDHELTLTDITLHAQNFKGRAEKDNILGSRHIAVVIPDGQEVRMAAEGWTVRHATAKNDVIVPFFRVYFPTGFDVSKITLNGTPLSPAEDLSAFDNLELLTGTLKIYGRPWTETKSKRTGIKAFLSELNVVTKP